jgi:hypothetical protein
MIGRQRALNGNFDNNCWPDKQQRIELRATSLNPLRELTEPLPMSMCQSC